MRRSFFISAAGLFSFALLLGPLTPRASGSERYGYRSHAYANRPTYRSYAYNRRHPTYQRAIYRPHFRPTYRTYHRPYYSYRPHYGRYWPSYYYRPYYSYRPYYYGPSFYASWAYPAPYGQLRYSYYAGGAVDYSYEHGAVRTDVRPKQAEVYVDGYYAGIVDDFDGTFQRLYLPPGQHEILVRLDGYRSHRQSLHVNSGTTYKLHHEMEPLGPGETTPPPPKPADEEPYVDERDAYEPGPPAREEEPRPPGPRISPAPERSIEAARSPAAPARFGLLTLRAQPEDVEVYIDDELWGSLAGIGGLTIHLPAGPRRIEVRKDGFQPFVTEIQIRQGETTPLNVKLERTNN